MLMHAGNASWRLQNLLVIPLLHDFIKSNMYLQIYIYIYIYIHEATSLDTLETQIEMLVLPSSCPGPYLHNNPVPIWEQHMSMKYKYKRPPDWERNAVDS
jgi:hypothetical protein